MRMLLVALVALLPMSAMAQDLDDMFDTVAYLIGKTTNQTYQIRNINYNLPLSDPAYLRWDEYYRPYEEKPFEYKFTYQMIFIPTLGFQYSIDTRRRSDGSEFCGVKIRNPMREGPEFLISYTFLTQFDKSKIEMSEKAIDVAIKAEKLSVATMAWYDCKTAVKIKDTLKAIQDKMGEDKQE